MPLMRYFVFVGGVLLALLFIADAWLPAVPAAQRPDSTPDLSMVRIHSDRKWPERVVFDTTLPTITPVPEPPAAVVAETASPKKNAAAVPPGKMREAFAQMTPSPGRLEPKRKRKSVAKNYAGPRNYAGPPRVMVAQQRPVFFFGNNIW